MRAFGYACFFWLVTFSALALCFPKVYFGLIFMVVDLVHKPNL